MIKYLVIFLLTTSSLVAQNWTFGYGTPGSYNPRVLSHPRNSSVALLFSSEDDVPFLTTDGGSTWKQLDSMLKFEYTFSFRNLTFTSDNGIGLAFVVDSSIARSTDLGETWIWTPSRPLRGELRSLAPDPFEPNSFLAFGGGPMRFTSDGGITWEAVLFEGTQTTVRSYSAAYAPSDSGVVYIVQRHLSVSTNGGRSFREVPHNPVGVFIPDVFGIDVHDAKRIHLMYRSSFYITHDGGQTWSSRIILPLNESETSLIQSTKDTKVFWASGRTLFRSQDYGENWTKMDIPWAKDYLKLGEIDGAVTVSIQDKGLFTTPDLGLSWYQCDTNIRARRVEEILMRDDSHWVVRCGTEILRTADAGKTWATVFDRDSFPSSTSRAIFDLASVDNWDTLIVSVNPSMYRTYDGKTWDKMSARTTNVCTSINWHKDNPNDILACSSKEIARSRDGGVTWSVQKLLPEFEGLPLVRGSSASRTFLKNTNAIYRLGITTDGGETWRSIDGPEYAMRALVAHRSNFESFFTIGLSGISLTKTAGAEWIRLYRGEVFTGYITSDPINDDLLYVYELDGSILSLNANTLQTDTLFTPTKSATLKYAGITALATSGTSFLAATNRGLMAWGLSTTLSKGNELPVLEPLSIAPMPAIEFFTVKTNDPTVKFIELTSLQGIVVRRIPIDPSANIAEGVRISTNGIIPGVYCVLAGKTLGLVLIL